MLKRCYRNICYITLQAHCNQATQHWCLISGVKLLPDDKGDNNDDDYDFMMMMNTIMMI